jgi:hypothetical protein
MKNKPLIFGKPQTRRTFLRQAANGGLFLAGSTFINQFTKLANASQSRYYYEGSEAAHVTFMTDPMFVQQTVPKYFQANTEGIMSAWFIYERLVRPKMAAAEYLKAILAIPVLYKGHGEPVKGFFIEKGYLNDQFRVYAAQEAYGHSTHYAMIDWSTDQNSIKCTVKKKDGTKVAHVTLSLSETKAGTQEDYVIYFNAQGHAPALKLNMTETHEIERERIPGKVVEADFFGIEVDEVLEAVYRKYDWSIPVQSESLAN